MEEGWAAAKKAAEGMNPVLASTVNSIRIGAVADKLMSSRNEDPPAVFHLCISLARGIDFGVANNEPPADASKLPPVLKQVCCRKEEFYLQSAIMVLMISVKNACKLGWFAAKETQELLALANEVGNYFCTRKDIDNETSILMPSLTSVMSRYYPAYKLGHVFTSFEVKPGYGTYLIDFHITKDLLIAKDERIRLLVAMKDNVETSSCIISPQQVNILLNGKPVDKRTNILMDPGPQVPTMVNHLLKFGTNLLQAVGQFNGNYILVIAAMSSLQTSDLPAPQDYVHPDIILSGPDSEVIEGASRISLNCPISYKRIKIPAKGHQCKHYQCFDLSNYVEINSKRASWRCPHCNQSVSFTDLRVDRMMVKVLQEVGENVSEVTIYADGSWKVASSSGKENSHDKTTNKQGEHETEESSGKSDGQCNVFDLTGEDYEMDTDDMHENIDKKPVVSHNSQGQPVIPNSASPSIPRSAHESFPFSFSQALTDGGISDGLLGNLGIAPVLTDAISPALNQQPHNFQGTNYPTSSIGISQLSNADNLQLQEIFHGRSIPRNVTRVPSAIQALPAQMPTSSSQQQLRPTMSLPAGSGSLVQMPLTSSQRASNTYNTNIERVRHLQQSQMNVFHSSSVHAASPPNQQGAGMSTPSHYQRIHPQPLSQPPHLVRSRSQTLSQPPHLMRSSQFPRNHPQQGVPAAISPNNSQSTVQRVQLPPSQASQVRQRPTIPQSHLARTSSSMPLNAGVMPQAVLRAENLIDLQQVEQTWRPTGRMRGALTGQAYSAALSQYMSPGSTPNPRSPALDSELQILLANRMISHATQAPNRLSSDGTAMDTSGVQGDGSRGVN